MYHVHFVHAHFILLMYSGTPHHGHLLITDIFLSRQIAHYYPFSYTNTVYTVHVYNTDAGQKFNNMTTNIN